MEKQQVSRAPSAGLPVGLTAKEATFLLTVFARLKDKGSGRLEVTVSDGRVVGVELIERLGRASLARDQRLG